MDYQATFGTEGVMTHDALIAGNAHLLVGRKVTLAADQNLVRGAVLGKVTFHRGIADVKQCRHLLLGEHGFVMECDATQGQVLFRRPQGIAVVENVLALVL